MLPREKTPINVETLPNLDGDMLKDDGDAFSSMPGSCRGFARTIDSPPLRPPQSVARSCLTSSGSCFTALGALKSSGRFQEI